MNPTYAWAGAFGDEYLKRNRVDWQKRISFWTDIIQLTGANQVLEVGCNAGWNLMALRTVKPYMRLAGIDVNETALKQAENLGFDVTVGEVAYLKPAMHDLVFTAGVLIHIPPEDIHDAMERIAAASKRYVLAVEYASESEFEVQYRGTSGMLWKRPFGSMYLQMGLKLEMACSVGKDQGFDNCTAWLMRI